MNRRLRVAVVARSVYPLHGVGGLERSVYDLVRYLARHAVDVTLITRDPLPDRFGEEIHPDVRVTFVPYRTFPLAGRRGTTVVDRSTAYLLFGQRAGRAAWTLAAARQIDLVHGFGASVFGYARRRRPPAPGKAVASTELSATHPSPSRGRSDLGLAGGTSAPLVLNPQGLEEFGATDPSRARLKRVAYLPLRAAVRACARAADRVIATDRALEPAVRQHLGVPADRVSIIPNALDLDEVDRLADATDGARVRRNAGIADDEAVLLSVGRLEQNKGFHLLAPALAALRDHSPRIAGGNWRWILAGDGPYRAQLERDIENHGLRNRTTVLGRVRDRDLHAWYEAATLFVHPTLYEGSSIATLEAMAHRRAVVATTAGGLPDKVRPGVNGWIVPPGDVSALAAAISGALAQPTRLPAMGRAGREIVEREFSWTVAGAATLRLYEDLV